MNLRHAPALALTLLVGCTASRSTGPTGWLIVAPQTGDWAHRKVDASTPLSSWSRLYGSGEFPYPSKEFCEQRLGYLRHQNQREGFSPAADPGLTMAQCVASDDPRLKAK